jgi:hypothetical protein
LHETAKVPKLRISVEVDLPYRTYIRAMLIVNVEYKVATGQYLLQT